MKPRRFDWYPADWLDGVGGMPPDQRGVYDTIINLIYARASEDGSIEMDESELAHRCFCHWRQLRRILAALVRGGKVLQEGRKITITRCAEEVQKACKRVAKAQQNGAKGGRPNDLDKPDGFENFRLTRVTTSNHQASDSKHQPERGVFDKPLDSPEKKDSSNTAQAPILNGSKNSGYAFAGKVIRLTWDDFDKWSKAYHAIPDLYAALSSLDIHYNETMKKEETRNWFIRCSKALENEHQKYIGKKYGNSINGHRSINIPFSEVTPMHPGAGG